LSRLFPIPTPGPVLFLGLVLLAGGCSTTSGDGGGAAADISELNLLTLPVALNLDGAPGADGVAIKLYAVAPGAPKPGPIRSGEVEILLFDGLLAPNSTTLPPPARTWRFTAKQLKEWEVRAMVGTGYQLTLRWDRFVPKGERVTVVARYALGKGRYLYSSPGVISCTAPK